jgi:hypothetical protein
MTYRPPARPKSRAWSQPLADLVTGVLDPVLAKQGFGQSDVILNWEEIVGERLAQVCEPIKMQWPTRAKNAPPERHAEPATLILRVESGFALELQHLGDMLIERVNAHLGWRCVGKIALRQGPLQRAGAKPVRVPPDAQATAQARDAAEGVENEALRAALTRLGAQIIAARTRAK